MGVGGQCRASIGRETVSVTPRVGAEAGINNRDVRLGDVCVVSTLVGKMVKHSLPR